MAKRNQIYLPVEKNINLSLLEWEETGTDSDQIILILHGLGGHSGYYDYFSQLLSENKYNVITYDRRGHGHSEGLRGDIDRYETDISDLNVVIEWIKSKHSQKNIYCFAESGGVLVLLGYLSSKNQEVFKGVIFSSPPITLKVSFRWIIPGLLFSLDLLKNLLLLKFNGYVGAPFPLGLASRDKRFFDLVENDKITNKKMTIKYAIETVKTFLNAQTIEPISVPLLVLFGTNDKLLNKSGAEKIFNASRKEPSEIKFIDDAYHTLYLDPETKNVIRSVDDWIDKTLST